MSRLLADIGGPFYDPSKPFRNWSALPFYQIDTAGFPYVDQSQLERGTARAISYLEQIHSQGYTGIVIDNLAHLVTFDQAPVRIYASGDPCRLRAVAYGDAFSQLFAEAAARKMEVFVSTDMQWSTPAVRRYAGKLHRHNQRLAEINCWALEELFARFPQVSGVFVRVGEAGGAHNQGDEYSGHMLYRTPGDIHTLLQTLLPICEQAGRLLVLRTWSIGIGELGDLMWSEERYRAVFNGIHSPHLLVSLKHGPSDFFRHLPSNPTLGLPGPAQIVELQNRREYELFGMVPSSIAALHQTILRSAARGDQHAGVWAWNGSGGWGGGTAALGDDGWSLWTELSSALTAAISRDPDLDTAGFVHLWCAQRFPEMPFAAAVADLYLDSADLIEQGWYMGALARSKPALGRLYLPTLLWTWWMRPTAAPVIWAYLAAAISDIDGCIAGSASASSRLAHHVSRLEALCPADHPGAIFVVESARYLRGCLAVSAAIRASLLAAAAAARRGDRIAWNRIAAQAMQTLSVLEDHRARWGGRHDFPALELDEMIRYLHSLHQRPGAAWSSMRYTTRIVEALHGRMKLPDRTHPAIVVSSMSLVALIGVGIWRRGEIRKLLPLLLAVWLLTWRFQQPVLRELLPWVSRRYFLLPSIFFETGPAFTEWTS